MMRVTMALQRKRKGTLISLAALIFWTISLSTLSFGMMNQDIFKHQKIFYAIAVSLLGSNVIMYLFLIIGKKSVQWKNGTLDEVLERSRNRKF